MNLRVVVIVHRNKKSQPDAWQCALSLPLGSRMAIDRYASLLAAQSRYTALVLPGDMGDLVGDIARPDLEVHTYDGCLAESSLGQRESPGWGEDLVLINGSRLPWVDLLAMQQTHRNAKAGMTVFYDACHEHYCREQIAVDAAGMVCRTVRQYTDSSCIVMNRHPIAAVLSRRSFRPDRQCRAENFSELVDYLDSRVRRAGESVHRALNGAVRGFGSPMEALLSLIERTGHNRGIDDSPVAWSVAGDARLHGAVEIGRNVHIGAGAVVVGPAALGNDVTVGPGAVVSHCIVLPGQEIPASSHCHHRVVGSQEVNFTDAAEREAIPCDLDDDDLIMVSTAATRLKRVIDVVGAAIGIVMLAPVFLIVALAIKLVQRGPVLYYHRRQGCGGVEFDCIKFCTMVGNADAIKRKLKGQNQVDGPQFKMANDPRVTSLGKILRKTNIDELPQLINVLRGEMSLVGPRPSPDNENQCCPPWRKARLSVRPGITGLWQVARSRNRCQTDFQEWIYYDTRYVEKRSLRLDMRIIWETLRVMAGIGPSESWRQHWQPDPGQLAELKPSVQPEPEVRVRQPAAVSA